jgi:hypothetical protein
LSKEIITIKAQLLAVVNTVEQAQELARWRNWSVSFTLGVMWSRFRDAGEHEEAQAALVLIQREEEHKGKGDSIFTER